MPRFSMKSLLVAFAVVALWMSTFSGFTSSSAAVDVYRSILLFFFVSSVCGIVGCSGRHRMFWLGFFLVMLIMGCRPVGSSFYSYYPDLMWGNSVANWLGPYVSDNPQSPVHSAIYWTVKAAWTLTLATLTGLAAAYIYDQSKKN